MPYKHLFVQAEAIQAAIAAMTELAMVRRAMLQSDPLPEAGEGETAYSADERPALRQIRQLEYYAEQVSDAVRYADQEPTKDEELAAIDELLKKASKEAGHHYADRQRARQLESYFDSLCTQKGKAYATLAAFADDQRVKLLALQFMIDAALACPTHRMKDSRLHMAQDAINAIVQGLSGIDKGNIWDFAHVLGTTGSWDYRKLAAEVYQKNQQIEAMQKRLEELEPQPSENGAQEPAIDF